MVVLILIGLSLNNYQETAFAGSSGSSTSSSSLTDKSKSPSVNGEAKDTKQLYESESYGNLPIDFEVNQGQLDAQVKFLSRANGYTFSLTQSEAVFSFNQPQPLSSSITKEKARLNPAARAATSQSTKDQKPPTVVRMQWLGANQNASLVGLEQLAGKSNYFIGNDPGKWHTDVSHYKQVQYKDIYTGIDLVFYGNNVPTLNSSGSGDAKKSYTSGSGSTYNSNNDTTNTNQDIQETGKGLQQLEYDFEVAPWADAGKIQLSYDGVQGIEVNSQGDLVLQIGDGGELVQPVPVIYQQVGTSKRPVSGRYKIEPTTSKSQEAGNGKTGAVVGFELGSYDHSQPLVIDPVLIYSKQLTGSYYSGQDIAVDNSGNAYVTGYGDNGVFVTKLNAAGSALIYSTFLGYGVGNGIAVDSSGNAYVTGYTDSCDFHLKNAYQQYCSGGDDAFVTKLNPDGNALVYSTYLGGSDNDIGFGIAVDTSGDAYVTGYTYSTDFPLPHAYQPVFKGFIDVFVTKFNASGSDLVYSTFLGWGMGFGIAADSDGNAYVTGAAYDGSFPVQNPLYAFGGVQDAFVTKLNPAGSALVYSTFLGGSNIDNANDITVDSSNYAYITGVTSSTNFPVSLNAYQGSLRSGQGQDAFVTKVNPAGDALSYSTYLGGYGSDAGSAIAVDNIGNVYITGDTSSTNFPLQGAYQSTLMGTRDAFVTILNPLNPGSDSLLDSTYFGDANDDSGAGIATDNAGNAFIIDNVSTNNTSSYVLIAKLGQSIWQSLNPGINDNLNGISCPFPTNCFIATASNQLNVSDGQVLSSVNGGISWVSTKPFTYPAAPYLIYRNINCPNASTCYVVGDKPRIFITRNGGSSWSSVDSGTYANLQGIECIDLTNCLAVGEGGTVVGTKDGVTWTSRVSVTNKKLNNIVCPSSSTCVAVGDGGAIIASFDGGSTWANQASGITSNLNSLDCPSFTTCFAVGSGGIILISSNAGRSWTAQSSGTLQELRGISCPDVSNCRVVGKFGTILSTSNSGTSWFIQNINSSYTLNKVVCASVTFCLAVGDNGVILTNSRMFLVNNNNDNGTGTINGTLSYALKNAIAGQTIMLAPTSNPVVTINVTGALPPLPPGVNLLGSCGVNGPAVTISGTGAPAGTSGLILKGNLVGGISISGFKGVQLKTAATANKLFCLKAHN